MRLYAKFMRQNLFNKRKFEEHETIMLIKDYIAILQNKLPPNLKDPMSFNIHCTIDLGASINLIPFFVFKKMGLRQPMATIVALQLAD